MRGAPTPRMNNGILLIAHAPLASAMRACVLHVFPDAADAVVALDVAPNQPVDEVRAMGARAMAMMPARHVLVLSDIFGATPCNVAQRLVDGQHSRLVTGMNLPMVLRAVTYRHEALDALVSRALAGGTQGVLPVAVTAPQNQLRSPHDPSDHDHQQ